MKIIKKVAQLQKEITKLKKAGKTIGFTPTMGALHRGHVTLAKQMVKENDIGIVSVFVNPTQFNEVSDLKNYPRTLKNDAALLDKAKVDIVFAPSTDEVYPKSLKTKLKLDLRGLDKRMEGQFRVGHFEGVCQVVKRLLDITTPDTLYMGQKDFQQFTIIGEMISTLKIPTRLVVCDIVRENSGLAMSSRNSRLTADHKKRATIIYDTLQWIKKNKNRYSISELKQKALDKMSIPGFKPEYVSIVNGNTLKNIRKMSAHNYVVVCTAVWAGEVRLIDNMILKK